MRRGKQTRTERHGTDNRKGTTCTVNAGLALPVRQAKFEAERGALVWIEEDGRVVWDNRDGPIK